MKEDDAPLVNTVYDDPRTEHVFDTLEGENAQFHNQRKAVCKQQGCLQSYHEYGIFIAFSHNIAWILPGK